MTTGPYREKPLVAGDGGPFGIIAEPTDQIRSTGIVLLNSGLLHRVGPSRLYVTLSRRLAELGFVTARIDISGKGDTPRRQNVDAKQSLLMDFDQWSQTFNRQYSIDKFGLIGLCSGADDAFTIAAERQQIDGLVMLDGYAARTWKYIFRHYASRLFQPDPWRRLPGRISRKLLLKVGASEVDEGELSMREIRDFPTTHEARQRFEKISEYLRSCLCVYTSASQSYYNYSGQLED